MFAWQCSKHEHRPKYLPLMMMMMKRGFVCVCVDQCVCVCVARSLNGSRKKSSTLYKNNLINISIPLSSFSRHSLISVRPPLAFCPRCTSYVNSHGSEINMTKTLPKKYIFHISPQKKKTKKIIENELTLRHICCSIFNPNL